MPNRWTRPTLIALTLCASAAPAPAEIFRGCRGWIEISSARVGPSRLAELDASGRCDNVRQANLCRDRAQRRINSCADALVQDMDGTDLPWQCTSEFRSGTRVNWFYWGGIDTVPYPAEPPSGYDRVARFACCRPDMHMEVTEVSFFAESTGDAGCYERTRLIGETFVDLPSVLEVNCAAEVARGICGPMDPPPQGELDRRPDPVRTTPPTRTNPPRPAQSGNVAGDGALRPAD